MCVSAVSSRRRRAYWPGRLAGIRFRVFAPRLGWHSRAHDSVSRLVFTGATVSEPLLGPRVVGVSAGSSRCDAWSLGWQSHVRCSESLECQLQVLHLVSRLSAPDPVRLGEIKISYNQ